MAEPTPIEQREPGAPVARDAIDPDLVKLARTRPKIGIITAAGIVIVCVLFLLRLNPDRRFAGSSAEPTAVTSAQILAGEVATDQLVKLPGELVIASALRTTNSKGSLGLRVVPIRGTADRLWLAASGDGWEAPVTDGYAGRLRKLDGLAFTDALRGWAAAHPRPVFAQVAAIRAAAAGHGVATVDGDTVHPADGDTIAIDRVDPDAATLVAVFNDRRPDTAAWLAALAKAGISQVVPGTPDTALGQIRFAVAGGVAATTAKLEAASLWASRVEPVTRHYETTWGALQKSAAATPGSLLLGDTAIPDAQIDLVGLYVTRSIPADAYVVVTGESPDDYWYVMPVMIAIAAILLVFAWALLRAIRRDLVPPRPA
ncbi:MAG TPA: hypothetical protein VH165_27765 [Kofleriaceae bacterium]|nr:hypothetical protein [Kofleriaceae bacterium]